MTKEIQNALATHLIKLGHEAVCENFGHSVFEMDVASISKSGMLHEFEVKISRNDFLCDKNKFKKSGITKFERYAKPTGIEWQVPNYFYYVCPEGMIEKNEIPLFAGLYYYDADKNLSLKKGAKKLHHIPSNREKIISKMLRMIIQRKYLGGTMLTYKNNLIREKYKNINPNHC